MTKDEAIDVFKCLAYHNSSLTVEEIDEAIKVLKQKTCKWIKYDYRTVCPKNHDVNNPYWRIPENRMDVLKYCPYCGNKIVIE